MENSAFGDRYSLGVENRNGTAELGNANTNITHIFSTDCRTRLHPPSPSGMRPPGSQKPGATVNIQPAHPPTTTLKPSQSREMSSLHLSSTNTDIWFGFVLFSWLPPSRLELAGAEPEEYWKEGNIFLKMSLYLGEGVQGPLT